MVKHLVLLCGGQSSEHEVSLVSAGYVLKAIDPKEFRVTVVVVQRSGCMNRVASDDLLGIEKFAAQSLTGPAVKFERSGGDVFLIDGIGMDLVDVVFPVLHGTLGEDGAPQGMLEFLGVPYVGAEVLSSALCMDKEVSKKLLLYHDIPVVPFIAVYEWDDEIPPYQETLLRLGADGLFIKPATQGSSIGIGKVSTEKQFNSAVSEAFRYSEKILIEKAICGQEIECAVLGNRRPRASCLGAIVPNHDFYSYEAKYLDPYGAEFAIPAQIPDVIASKIQDIAIKSFSVLQCVGMARVDFFLTNEHEIYVNELNTIPGFTEISMYSKLWKESGLSYPGLIKELIDLSYDRSYVKRRVVSGSAGYLEKISVA